MLDSIAAEGSAFTIHAGDIKSSKSQCCDKRFLDRHTLFHASSIPFIYVPDRRRFHVEAPSRVWVLRQLLNHASKTNPHQQPTRFGIGQRDPRAVPLGDHAHDR